MHPLYEKADRLSSELIGAAIEVHRHKGPGLIESIYERCLLRELELRSLSATTRKIVRVEALKGICHSERSEESLISSSDNAEVTIRDVSLRST